MKLEYKLLTNKDCEDLEKDINKLSNKGWIVKSFRVLFVQSLVWKYVMMVRPVKLRNME